MNITLLVVILLIIIEIVRGYQKGMAKELLGLIALGTVFFVLAILIMLFSSFEAGETTNVLYSFILLVVLGIVYGIIKFILKSVKAVSHLPVFHFMNCLLGSVIGVAKAVLIIWIVFLLCARGYLGPLTGTIQEDIMSNTFLKILYQGNIFVI
ncbi:MAG: CvpA family protein [Lachnospiraceae bacterium]|nr:CvpA family protein [Lachnospiraceae bacterium]